MPEGINISLAEVTAAAASLRATNASLTDTLNQIRTGEIELCQGYTGSSFPAISYAHVAWTPWRAAEIVIDRLLSTP